MSSDVNFKLLFSNPLDNQLRKQSQPRAQFLDMLLEFESDLIPSLCES